MILAFYTLFVVITLPTLYVRNRLAAFLYSTLFVYSFFAILGYLYFPGYSESMGAYFGDWAGQKATWFIFFSMALFFGLNMWSYRPRQQTPPALISVSTLDVIPLVRIVPIYLVLAVYVVGLSATFNELSWYLAELDKIPLEIQLMILLFKMSIGFFLFLYVALRENRFKFSALFAPSIFLFGLIILTAIKLGNRTDVVAIVLGVAYYESSVKRLSPRFVVGAMVFLGLAGSSISAIELIRYNEPVVISSLSEKIIKNDYFPPAHMLFAVIAYNFRDPYEVIQSNVANAAMFLRHPFLQQTVTDLFSVDLATRTASYAFYILTEGFIFAGFFGVFYNGIMLTILLKMWNSLMCTNDRLLNLVIGTLFASMMVNIARGQTSYFFKYTYLYTLPTVVLMILILGVTRVRKQQISTAAPR